MDKPVGVARWFASACVLTILVSALQTSPAQAADAGVVLGAAAGDWTITDKAGKPAAFTVTQSHGADALLPGTFPIFFTHAAGMKPGTEARIVLRLANESAAASLRISSDWTEKTPGPGALALSVDAPAGGDTATFAFRRGGQGAREFLVRRQYSARWMDHTGLGLAEDIRKRVEHEIASLPKLHQRWLTVRWQTRANGSRLYVDDRLLWEGDAVATGRFRVDLTKGVELASLQLAALPPAEGVYETVPLDGYVNAATLDGARIKTDPPASGGVVTLGGVPFVLPKPDPRGNDHVDLEPSWLQCGFFGGRDSPRSGAFGGRWDGAWSRNPARIQFAIPSGRYSAIHLLAAADSAADSVPVVHAQFYQPDVGRPVQIRCDAVAGFSAAAPNPALRLPATLDNGRTGALHRITIPVDPGLLASIGRPLEMELTKEVHLYRAYPDPMFYSFHQAGLPSSVHVFAVTLERPAVQIDLAAANGLHAWTAPEKPAYVATLTSNNTAGREITLDTATVSYDRRETTRQSKTLTLRPGEPATMRLELDLKSFGWHEMTLSVREGNRLVQTEKRGLALLHPDTRERGGWERGKGPMFGFWNWRGGHNTPPEPTPTLLMGMAGAEAEHGNFDEKTPPDLRAAATKYGIQGYKAFGAGDHYITLKFASQLQELGLDKARESFLTTLKDRYVKPDELNRSAFVSFFPEPSVGAYTSGNPLSYDGEPETQDYTFSEAEEKRFQFFLEGFNKGAPILKGQYPNVACLFPHGDPGFPIPFLRRSAEFRRLFEGLAVDVPVFEKLPESQLHQVSLHRLYILREEMRKAGVANPWMPMYEGPCLPTRPGSLTPSEHAALSVRDSLILIAYGVDFQAGGWAAYDAGSYWGEQHYGGGICDPLPLATPKPSYAAFATMTRHLNRRNFEKWVPTGSLSVYALQFKHFKDGSLVHTLWTIRGRRPVTVAVPPGANAAVYDAMDNRIDAPAGNGAMTFTIGQAPCFVTGLADAPEFSPGAPDHSDAAPAPNAVLLSRMGDGSWTVSEERDTAYEDSARDFIRRYPARMTARAGQDAPGQDGPALAVHLEKPERERRTMPFYTTLTPAKPVAIPGKASHLGLWVRAASDWGRVVYSLRDAKGERWISIGTKGAWNCDDIHAWSYFNFDGWRFVRFELPACAPYDLFREAGTTWWGRYSAGDGVPDLPLSIEKIIIERRTHAMYVNDPQPASAEDVLLGGLYAEYENAQDAGERSVRLAALRMPVPAGAPDLDNPIARLAATGVGDPVAVTEITVPLHESDGTQCHVVFATSPNAATYEIWASPYADGRGAVRLADKVKEPGARVRGLRPDTDFYLFVAYADAKGKLSKPSKAFKINLKDTFGMK